MKIDDLCCREVHYSVRELRNQFILETSRLHTEINSLSVRRLRKLVLARAGCRDTRIDLTVLKDVRIDFGLRSTTEIDFGLGINFVLDRQRELISQFAACKI